MLCVWFLKTLKHSAKLKKNPICMKEVLKDSIKCNLKTNILFQNK
jgi:hypothetical protein